MQKRITVKFARRVLLIMYGIRTPRCKEVLQVMESHKINNYPLASHKINWKRPKDIIMNEEDWVWEDKIRF